MGFTQIEIMLINAGMAHKRFDDGNQNNTSFEEEKSFEELLCDVGQNKNKKSFIALFEHFAPRIKSYLMKSGADESNADELAQETMLSVWDKAKSYNPDKAAASTWIFTVARNKRIDALRKIKSYSVDIDDMPFLEDENASNPSQNMAFKQESQSIYSALKSLPENQAELIRKSFFEDKTHNEISEETGIPLGTVKSRIRLALDRLRHENAVKQLWN